MKATTIFKIAATVVVAIALPGIFTSRQVDTAIEINAPATEVWNIFSDFSRYGEWNPFIIKVNGITTSPNPIAVTIRPAIGGEMDFKLLLKSVTPPQEMIWTGKTIAPHVLDGRHYFRVEALDDNRTRFSQGESYRGALLYFSWPLIKWSVSRSFSDMNLALKNRAESLSNNRR